MIGSTLDAAFLSSESDVTMAAVAQRRKVTAFIDVIQYAVCLS